MPLTADAPHVPNTVPPLDTISEAFSEAVSRVAVNEYSYRIANATVLVRIVGDSLVAPLTRALAHLVADPVERPDLIINSWDTAESGISPDLPPVDPGMRQAAVVESPHGGPRRWGSPALVGQSEASWTLWRPGFGSLSAVAAGGREAFHWVESAAGIQYWDVSTPFKAIFHRWARERDMQLVHAGAVGVDDRAVLFVGNPGSGKSTTSLVCLSAGMRYLGDDYVIVGLDGPDVHSISCAAKLEAPQAERYGYLMPTIWNGDRLTEEKAVAFVDHRLDDADASCGLSAIVVPRISGRPDTTAEDLTAAEAMRALAPSTMIQMPGSKGEEFAALARLVKKVPTVGLHLGSNLDTIPPVVIDILSG